jgi:hypothetical protein
MGYYYASYGALYLGENCVRLTRRQREVTGSRANDFRYLRTISVSFVELIIQPCFFG